MDNEKKTDNTDLIERAKSRLKRMVSELSKTHEIGRECMEMVAGDQWEPDEIKARESTGRPMVTINRLSPFVNQVVNKNSMERARIKAVPFEDSDTGKGKVINGLLRHIQSSEKSEAGEAFANTFFNLGSAGFGYFRIDTEYCNELSMDQDILIHKIEDPFSVYLDPDGDFAIIVDYVDKDVFKEEHGERTGGDWDVSNELERPHLDDVMRVEYWERTWEKTELYQIEVYSDIATLESENDLDQAIQQSVQPGMNEQPIRTVIKKELDEIPEGTYQIIKQRSTKLSTVKRYIFSGEDMLSSDDWPGKYIPIVGCYAREHTLKNGEKFFKAIIKDAIDPQKMYNFYKSQDAELMQQAPKSTWQGAKGSFKGFEQDYDEANMVATARLEYNPIVINGVMAPPPQRVAPPMPSQGYYANITQASDEIKACIGIFDPSLGEQGNEVAARAILARQKQGDISTYHYTMAFNIGLYKAGVIIVDLIRSVYTTARSIRILGDDMADEVVKINQSFVDKDRTTKMYDMSVGEYDIKIDIGASSATRRMDAAENLLEFARVVPKAGELGADMIVGNLDFEKSDELSMRLRAALPPELLMKVDMMQKGASPEMIQLQMVLQQLQQAGQMIQGMGEENKQLKQRLGKMNIEETQIEAQTGIAKEKIKAGAEVQKEVIRQRFQPSMPPGAGPVGRR